VNKYLSYTSGIRTLRVLVLHYPYATKLNIHRIEFRFYKIHVAASSLEYLVQGFGLTQDCLNSCLLFLFNNRYFPLHGTKLAPFKLYCILKFGEYANKSSTCKKEKKEFKISRVTRCQKEGKHQSREGGHKPQVLTLQ
jgi:hypothetical protein